MNGGVAQDHEAAKRRMPRIFRQRAPLKFKLFLSRWYWRWVDGKDYFVVLSDVDLRMRLGRLAFEGTIADYPIDTHMSATIATLHDAIQEWKRVEP